MTNLMPARMGSTLPSKLALPLLIVGALLCMGAKWAEKPIESLASIAGEWRGLGTGGSDGHGPTHPGMGADTGHAIRYVFKQDGSYNYSWAGQIRSDRGQRPPGTVRLHAGKLEWKGLESTLWTATLYEDKKGKRLLKSHREDGGTWQLKATGVLFIMDVKDVVGMWKGMYETAQGGGPLIVATLEIKEDGSYVAHRGSGSARGMVQIRDGKLQYQDAYGYTLALTLYERKGKYILKGMTDRGSSFKFKRVEKKRRSKK